MTIFSCLLSVEEVGITTVKVGKRQQLLFSATAEQMEELDYHFFNQELLHEVNENQYPNIVSSYVADGIYNRQHWLREGVYKDILTSFEFTPRLKINIVDANQSFVPYYTGNLNFVSSKVGNYWHVYIRWPKTNELVAWSSLVYSMDIAAISQELEAIILGSESLSDEELAVVSSELESKIKETGRFHFQYQVEPLVEAEFRLPYYEGFNSYDNKYWLGIYRPDESYTVSFLLDVCRICQASRVGQVYMTPWRSLIIKEIREENRKEWDVVLDRHRVNLRHASNELNWQIEDWCESALKLKRTIVRYFDRWNLRTYRLCFGIKIGSNTGIWGSIILRKISAEGEESRFDVFHTKDFNANSHILVLYEEEVLEKSLPRVLKTLCDSFYDATLQKGSASELDLPPALEASQGVAQGRLLQCPYCLSIYDPEYGDVLALIEPGVAFDDLPADYTRGLCGAPKADFRTPDKSIQKL